MKHRFDVIVVGGGHAGCEAAHAAARMGADVAMVTLKADTIGAMSCNPAIGGLGKGHLVREIDAMDGVMGRVADAAGIQFRLLNRRKGPAVQGPRAQSDRKIYRLTMQAELRSLPNLQIIEAEVSDLLVTKGRTVGVELADGTAISSASVILTTGTFLRGIIHIGDVQTPGGRVGELPSVRLADRIDDLGLSLGRLKTGTPPRLHSDTIDWDLLEEQPGDTAPVMFSFLNAKPALRQVACGITHTNSQTHEIIQSNLSRSAMYGGHIDGVGPRYCPSIEDKVVRFADKSSHQIFLEPEGLDDKAVYPNGISTSLPIEVQEEYVHSIKGLESAKIMQPGYAIEYDYVDPRGLDASLQVRNMPGLFLAGQINGTTGYEEAAAQGLVAAINAVRESRNEAKASFDRTESYIGVMIDDLTTRGVSEPYRMFTSRAEFRLALRADNADQRLTEKAVGLGLVGSNRREVFARKMEKLDAGRKILSDISANPSQINAAGIAVNQDGKKRTGMEILAFPDVKVSDLAPLCRDLERLDEETKTQLEREALYVTYIERQKLDVARLKRDEALAVPSEISFDGLSGLSNELQSKLTARKPSNMREVSKIEGMTPAALALILATIRKFEQSEKRARG